MTRPAGLPCVDLARALSRLGGDARILRNAAADFERLAPGSRDNLLAAVARRDRAAIEFSAHRLRGQASTFDALELVDAIRTIESMTAADPGGSDEAWADLTRAVDRVDLELSEVIAALRAFAAGGSPRAP